MALDLIIVGRNKRGGWKIIKHYDEPWTPRLLEMVYTSTTQDKLKLN